MAEFIRAKFAPRRRRAPRTNRRSRGARPFRFALLLGTIFLLWALTTIHFLPDRISLKLGEKSPTAIRATRSVSYVDTQATYRLRETRAADVESVYDTDDSAVRDAAGTVASLFREVVRRREDASLKGREEKIQALKSQVGTVFSESHLRRLLSGEPAELARLQAAASRLAQSQIRKGIRSDTQDIAQARLDIERAARREFRIARDAEIVRAAAGAAIRPNLIYNAAKTERLRHQARRSTPPVVRHVSLGEVILRPGEVFTQEHLDQCVALGLINPRVDPVTAISLLALISGMVALVIGYIRRTDRTLFRDNKRLFLLCTIVVVSVLSLRAFGILFGVPVSGVQFGYLGMMTVVAAGMMITVLLNPTLAMLATALLAVQSGLIMNHEIRFTVMTLLSGLVGIYAVYGLRDRSHLLTAMAAVAGANVLMVWALGGLLGDSPREILAGTAGAVLSAGFAILIFWFGVALLEKPFGVLTHAWLLELSSPDQPLLKELCVVAPGTYAHSIGVANLAEAAAESIGADKLFCRVASYYHDIGKMKRPHCFVENQGAENIHDALNPSLSALIIASHVKDGLQMAEERRLPRQICDIIAEHHGTSLIRYFYHQALGESPCVGQGGRGGPLRDPVLEQHFRYDGPRPRTRESGIIMLADTVEAAARCLTQPSPARIQGLIETLVRDKITDGQLDECDLTFRDIQAIQTSFARILTAVLHRRIEYPAAAKSTAETALAPRAAQETDADSYPLLASLEGTEAAVEESGSGSPLR